VRPALRPRFLEDPTVAARLARMRAGVEVGELRNDPVGGGDRDA
jgi:hypothetical protein